MYIEHKINWGEYMRNLINYFYQLEPKDIHKYEHFYTFEINGENYRLQEVYDININQAYNTSISLYQIGFYTHQIMETIAKQYIVNFNKKNYVLIKYYGEYRNNIDISLIKNIQISEKYLDRNKITNNSNWGILWSKKIDYFEYQMNQFGIKYPLIRESFSYYLGLAEVGIALFNNYYEENQNLYLAHKRIKSSSSEYELYDPFNLVLDLRVRDIAEYFKSEYIENNNIFEDIKKYLDENLSNYEKIMFFIRMFYPSFYFDIYEKIIDLELEEGKIKEIIEKSSQYDLLLKEIYNYLLMSINLPYISWLRNV